MFSPDDLRSFANRQKSGYLKFWKALSIHGTLQNIPDILSDKTRLTKYLDNCLKMEGFTDEGIEAIVNKVYENRHTFFGDN